ncbi:hypothetical protein C1645_828274 [Glomus cerebriforme]|uniref:F-box domain-containing protein n=1 Tax=Glomus cerebriforme TaxID=658196 RepID=A0A397ST45_9GLOM|nr:hypothetical protein C1645_828274 [Glomus cerebriforme]
MMCSKLFSGDIPELTSRILQNLHNDYSSLYSCALVNRFWCRLAIPILWSDPFSSIFNKNKQLHFIDIYLSSLNEDDKITLMKLGLGHKRIELLSSIKPLFNYPNLIKVLDTYKVETTIKLWSSLYLKHDLHFSYLSILASRKERIFLPTVSNHYRALQNQNPFLINPNNLQNLPTYIPQTITLQTSLFARRNALPNLMINSRNPTTRQNNTFSYGSYALRRRNALIPRSIGYLQDKETKILNKSTKFIYMALLKLFIEKNVTLNTFDIILQHAFGNESLYDIYELILNNSKLFYKNEYLKIDFNYKLTNSNLLKIRKFFTHLPTFSTSIKHLILQFITINDKCLSTDIARLIDSQSQLSTISFKQIDMDIFGSLLFLKSCSSSLISITFDECDFKNVLTLEGLGYLKSLESLHFINCISLNEIMIQSYFINLSTPINIKSFTFFYTNRSYDILEFSNPISHLFIQKFGKSLQNLTLSLNGFRSNDISEAISGFCETINFLHLNNISHKNISTVLQIIKILNNTLKYLTLEVKRHNIIYTGRDEYECSSNINSNLLKSLGNSLPKKLIYLDIYLIVINSDDLIEFFRGCKEVEFTKLLIRSDNKDSTEKILDIITEFVKGNEILEYLSYESDIMEIFPDTLYHHKSLEEKIKKVGSKVKIKRYNELVIKVDNN